MNLLQILHDGAYVGSIVNTHLDGSLKDTFLAGDENLVNVHTHLR